ncbi:MAG TPA: DUF6062 family protein [Solirubrobacter sp.]|nr:DUF6062 family protein [Solirubrobacter sp.]
MPNSALTRWLKQGLARGECPLCRVAHKADREYLWNFFEENVHTDAGVTALRAGRGFCLAHGEALCRLEIDGFGSTLGITEIYEVAFAGIVAELDALDGAASAQPAAPCPACVNRERELHANARHLVALLGEDPRSRARYRTTDGLCLPHFALVWPLAAGDTRDVLLTVQRASAHEVLDDLRHDRDGWRRALHLTGGWPAPDDLIGRPEARVAAG